MLGKEPFGEFSDVRRFLPGRLIGRRIGAALDHAEQAFRFAAGRFGGPGRAMLSDRHLAQRRAAPDASAVMDDVALGAAPLNPTPEALQLAIPQHQLAAICPRFQRVHRSLRDLAAHRRLGSLRDTYPGLGIA